MGAFNPSLGKILGNWGYDDSTTDGGLWEMNKYWYFYEGILPDSM